MKIGLIVDGQSEYQALGTVLTRCDSMSGNICLRPIRADIQPHSPTGTQANVCKSRIKLLTAKGANRIIVLVDRETRDDCPSVLASQLEQALSKFCPVDIHVVIKDRTFENWLIADLSALRQQRARFRISAAMTRRVEPDKADHIGAGALLNSAAIDRRYDKIDDSKKILERQDPLRAALHSRSFRRLLRLIGVPQYATQSALP